jgi:hypothetical protein
MDMIANEIYAQYGDSLITIVTTNGAEFVANIVKVTGGLSVGNKETIPGSTFLEINRFVDARPFSKPNLGNHSSSQNIHPNEVAEIRQYLPSSLLGAP